MLEARGMDIGYFRVRPARDFVPTSRGLERVRTPNVAVTHDDRRMSVAIGSSNCQHGLREIGDAILTGRVEPEGDGIVLKIKGSAERSTYTTPLLTRDDLFPPKWHSRFHYSSESDGSTSTDRSELPVTTMSGRIERFAPVCGLFTTRR